MLYVYEITKTGRNIEVSDYDDKVIGYVENITDGEKLIEMEAFTKGIKYYNINYNI